MITLEPGLNGGIIMASDVTWSRGICDGQSGSFPTDVVYVLPTTIEPVDAVIKLFKDGAVKSRKHAKPNYNTMQRQKMYTLRKYATENFRANIE